MQQKNGLSTTMWRENDLRKKWNKPPLNMVKAGLQPEEGNALNLVELEGHYELLAQNQTLHQSCGKRNEPHLTTSKAVYMLGLGDHCVY